MLIEDYEIEHTKKEIVDILLKNKTYIEYLKKIIKQGGECDYLECDECPFSSNDIIIDCAKLDNEAFDRFIISKEAIRILEFSKIKIDW